MEALSGGPSVLAFLSIAIKTTEGIYKLVSCYRDAPDQAKRLATAIQDLSRIFKCFSSLQIFVEDRETAAISDLKGLLDRYVKDVDKFSMQLTKFLHQPDGKKLERVWKNIRTVLRKDDLSDMWTALQHYGTVIGLQLDLIRR